jgi:hypothetical protein
MSYSYLTLNLRARHSLESSKSEMLCFIRISCYKCSRYGIFFKSCSIEIYTPGHERTTYKFPWEKEDLGLGNTIQTLVSGDLYAATTRTYYQYTILRRVAPSVITPCGHHICRPSSATSIGVFAKPSQLKVTRRGRYITFKYIGTDYILDKKIKIKTGITYKYHTTRSPFFKVQF